jgi:hypothetical protein
MTKEKRPQHNFRFPFSQFWLHHLWEFLYYQYKNSVPNIKVNSYSSFPDLHGLVCWVFSRSSPLLCLGCTKCRFGSVCVCVCWLVAAMLFNSFRNPLVVRRFHAFKGNWKSTTDSKIKKPSRWTLSFPGKPNIRLPIRILILTILSHLFSFL